MSQIGSRVEKICPCQEISDKRTDAWTEGGKDGRTDCSLEGPAERGPK